LREFKEGLREVASETHLEDIENITEQWGGLERAKHESLLVYTLWNSGPALTWRRTDK